MKTTLSALLVLITFAAKSQIISSFTWTSTPLVAAATGPNGTSVSSSATSAYIGGTLGYALNPGSPTKNVDLLIPGAPYDVDGIDMDLYFRREESQASFFKRGSLFNFQMNSGALYITFTTTQGSTPGNLTINSGNIFTLANDHAFHHYRFRYDNNTGVANVWVDDVIVYTYTGVAGRPLSWTGAGDVIIGENMDATGHNVGILSNFTVQNVSASTLPVELLSFTAKENNTKIALQWSTDREIDFSYFIVERSANGNQFTSFKKVNASGSPATIAQYRLNDESPLSGTNYYRLKMIDKDGSYKYSDVVKVSASFTSSATGCFPNPATDYVNLSLANAQAGTYDYAVTTIQGNIVKAATVHLNSGVQQIKIDLSAKIPASVLIIKLYNRQSAAVELFRVVKG